MNRAGLVERLAAKAGERPGHYPHSQHAEDARWWLAAIAVELDEAAATDRKGSWRHQGKRHVVNWLREQVEGP